MEVAVFAALREGELPLLTASKVDSAVKQLEDNGGLGVATHRLFQVLAGGLYTVVDELPEGARQTIHCLTQAVEGTGQSEGVPAAKKAWLLPEVVAAALLLS